jgi:hypothetical protein
MNIYCFNCDCVHVYIPECLTEGHVILLLLMEIPKGDMLNGHHCPWFQVILMPDCVSTNCILFQNNCLPDVPGLGLTLVTTWI